MLTMLAFRWKAFGRTLTLLQFQYSSPFLSYQLSGSKLRDRYRSSKSKFTLRLLNLP